MFHHNRMEGKMPPREDEMPSELKRHLRASLLESLRSERGLDMDELSLFEWHAREHSQFIEQMLSVEREYLQQQDLAGIEGPNDSGIVAVEYYSRRARYGDVIYIASLLEIYLERSCRKLERVMHGHGAYFRPDELAGDKWTKRKKFLEHYGQFSFAEPEWSELKGLIVVRNNLVHDNGDTATLTANDKNQIKNRPGIRADGPELVIDAGFVDSSLAAFRSLDQSIQRNLNEVIARAERLRSVAMSNNPVVPRGGQE